MILKDDAKQAGFQTKTSSAMLPDERAQKLEQLKAIVPSLINGDGVVDVKALQDLLDPSNVASNSQGYGLTFAGKGLAKAKADKPTNMEFKLEVEQSKNLDKTQNTIIRGDNLDVLKLLRQNYTGKIKMIYIDPPYNTGSANFVYNDSFKESEAELIENYGIDEEAIDFFENILGTLTHSGWLFAMYPRLKLARDLLTDDGVILIQIDYNESHALKLLMDEIFGESNFKEEIIWEYRTGGMPKKSSCFGKKHDVIFAYSKDSEKYSFNNTALKEKNYYDKPFFGSVQDDDGRHYASVSIRDVIGGDITILEDEKEIVENLKPLINTSSERIEGFDSQKPPNLIKFLAKFYIRDCKDSIVMDFFAGSGTTAQAVMDFNQEYSSNNKFILVQQDEKISSDNKLYKLCEKNKIPPTITDVCIWRVDSAGENLKKKAGMLGKDLDIGYKVFSLTPRPELNEELQLNITRTTTQNTLYNMIAASGECLLSDTIEEIDPDLLYKVRESYFVLGECRTNLEQFSSNKIYIDGYADISLTHWLNMLGLNKDTVTILY